MSIDTNSAEKALRNAAQALKDGESRAARQSARLAVSIDPTLADAWLILAQISDPHARPAYIQQVLKFQPGNPTALTALRPSREMQEREVNPLKSTLPAGKSASIKAAAGRGQLLPRFLRSVGIFVVVLLVIVALLFAFPNSFSQLKAAIFLQTGFYSLAAVGNPQANAQTVSLSLQAPDSTASPTTVSEVTATAPQQPAAINKTGSLSSSTADAPGTQPAAIFSRPKVYIPTQEVTATQESTATLQPTATPEESPTPPPTLTPGVQPPPIGPLQNNPKSIVVSVSQQHAYAYEGNRLVYSFVASTGANNSTLPGTFSILDKEPNAYSYPWDFNMPYWMGIYYVGYDLENGFHSLPVYANGLEIWRNEIGKPITGGCVVLLPNDMKQLYDWASVGTPVQIVP
jgi:lipoprotein-anchoring transpeptidase ErfK/SrfK